MSEYTELSLGNDYVQRTCLKFGECDASLESPMQIYVCGFRGHTAVCCEAPVEWMGTGHLVCDTT